MQFLTPIILKLNKDVLNLANYYLKENLLSSKHFYDILHLAITTYYNLDVIYSWDKRHIVKERVKLKINKINRDLKLKNIKILSPVDIFK